MVLKIYGGDASNFVRLVIAVCLEKQVPFELVPVDISKGENKTPEYLAKHPFGQIPCIDDDGFILYESAAITYYIASKYANQGTPLLPTGLQGNALHQQAVFVQASHFNQHAVPAVTEKYTAQLKGVAPNKDVVDKHLADFSSKLDVYDKILSKQKYLLGDEIYLVDFYHLPIAGYLKVVGIDTVESKPNVARWIKDVSSRHSWASTAKPAA